MAFGKKWSWKGANWHWNSLISWRLPGQLGGNVRNIFHGGSQGFFHFSNLYNWTLPKTINFTNLCFTHQKPILYYNYSESCGLYRGLYKIRKNWLYRGGLKLLGNKLKIFPKKTYFVSNHSREKSTIPYF